MKCSAAIDLGTTTLAGRLLGEGGEPLSEIKIANPQREFGTDILTRLQKAHDGEGANLQRLLTDGLEALLKELFASAGRATDDLITVAVAGNPGISCLLQRRSVSSLLYPPHKPPQKDFMLLSGEALGLDSQLSLELFPLASGFVGGDLVACLYALKDVSPGTLLIDIGTNAELALWDGRCWWVTSAAAGPAFEGGNVNTGMIAADGAVSNVELVDDRLQLTVLGGGRPQGLCGSGLAALIAVAQDAGLVDKTGRIVSCDEVDTNLGRYLVAENGGWAIRFHRDACGDLVLTQADLRNFQLAKGAVLAGVQVLLQRGGFTPEKVSEVLVTGALGTALPVEVLKRVALLPEAMLDKTSFIANGVLAGLEAYLVDKDGRRRLDALTKTIQSFPLSGTPAFEKLFLTALEF